MKVKDLKPNKRNPRKITDEKLSLLEKSMEKFGDLSGFVYNRRTKSLISGHQRQKTLPENAVIKVEHKHDKPTQAFTMAEGYVLIGDERFKYREVDAPEEWEVEAMLAANKHGGEWDNDILKLNFSDFPNIDLDATGFDIPELESMDIEFNPTKISGFSMVEDDEDDETDEQYVRNTPTTFEEIDTEKPESNIKYEKKEKEDPAEVFDKTEESQGIVGKRFVIILDCKDGDHKKEIKELLKPILDDKEVKIF